MSLICIHLVILSYITGNFITIHISFYGWQRIRDSLCVILYWLNRLTAGISSAVFWIPCRPITANHSYVEYGIWQNKGAYERDSYGNVYSGSSFGVIYSYHQIEQLTYRNVLGFFSVDWPRHQCVEKCTLYIGLRLNNIKFGSGNEKHVLISQFHFFK